MLINSDQEYFLTNKQKIRRHINRYLLKFTSKPSIPQEQTTLVPATLLTRNIEIILNDEEVKRSKLSGAMADQIDKKVIIDNTFLTLPPYVQRFAIYHEIGHITDSFLYHQYTSQELYNARIRAIKRGFVTSLETDADNFAASMIGKTATLKAIQYLLEQAQSSFAKTEWTCRYKKQQG